MEIGNMLMIIGSNIFFLRLRVIIAMVNVNYIFKLLIK
jgi:hypothetical protein